jgi:spermidine synthase
LCTIRRVIPWNLLGTAHIPGDGGEMRLLQRGDEYSIRVGGYELMNSRVHGSEDALASLVCERLDCERARILIGGLGMGFTLLAVLKSTGPGSAAVVSELVPEVVEWHRGPLAAVSDGALDDPRVTVRTEDVAKVLRAERNGFDAVLLDVDNGPVGLTARKNDWLYSPAGLKTSYAALRPGGILAVWSAGPDAAFTRRLQQAGFQTEEVRVRGREGKRGPRYLIWLARRA